jgi:uncharacterized membrane protein
VSGLDWDSTAFTLCGYHRVTLKPDAHLVARYRDDPMVATGDYGQGRTAIFASDFAPHWAGDFPHWEGYATFWTQMLRWLAGDGG